jgi:GH25 family lysozyme M1 (1,4-beta-N-acetylmuramidase)
MDENNNLEDLQKAYEADRQRKASKEEELKDAKEYLELLLKEVEGKEAEAASLRESLAESKEKIDQLTVGPKAKQSRLTRRVLLVLAIVELVCIIGLLAYFVFIKESPSASDPDESVVAGENAEDAPGVVSTVLPEKKKYRENLEALAPTIIAGNFKCTCEQRDGLEYLVFSDGKISIGYKNEYYADEVALRNCVFVEKNGRRYLFTAEYDLTGDLLRLVPSMTRIGESRYLVFTGAPAAGSGIPSMLRIFDCDGFKLYESDHLEKLLLGLFDFEYSEEQEEEEQYVVLSAQTSKARYRYKLDSAEYDQMVYFERHIPDVYADFTYEIAEDGIHWSTLVKLYDKYVLGTLEGSFGPSGNEIGITDAKYASFIQKEYADPAGNGLIIPRENVPDRYYTIYWDEGERFLVEIDESLKMVPYDFSRLNTDDPDNFVYYDGDGQEISIRGIDVSKFQGSINWKKVAAAGVKFAIIRLGYRGMNEGTLEIDNYYRANIEGATANGIKVGVYFFSEAITTEEAVEEAEYVLKNIKSYNVTYPIVFDTEKVTTFDARANNLSMAERTDICIAFCDRIREAGYTPMIYANTRYMLTGIDLSRLEDIEKWFAVYSKDIKFPYEFGILQYSESGKIDGIGSNVDLDIAFKDYSEK